MKLSEWLKSTKTTQREFGELVGRDRLTVLRWCNGTTTPNKTDLLAIQNHTGGQVTPNDMITMPSEANA